MTKSVDIVIIGGGVQGLSLAYNLARRGVRRITVLEKSYIGSGASGRNGEVIRSAFGSRQWINLYDTSLKMWETLSSELDFNVMFTRCGYLVLAHTPAALSAYRGYCRKQNELGLNTRIVDIDELKGLTPALNADIALGGILQKTGGVARHDAVVWAFARAARRLGVKISPYTEVVDIIVKSGKVMGVKTDKENISSGVVVNAAGAFAGKVAEMVGVNLPVETFRLEMIVTEPLKPFLRVALSSPHLHAYMHQTARGEFAGGAVPDNMTPFFGLKATKAAMQDMARKFVLLFPGLQDVKMMRQWTGVVSRTPDRGPLLGAVDDVEGFFLNAGWGGYGFMGSPAGGYMLAERIVNGKTPACIRPFSLNRYKTGDLIKEPTLVGAKHEK